MHLATRLPVALLWFLCQFAGRVTAQPLEYRVIVKIDEPIELKGEFEGLLANFSTSLNTGNAWYQLWVPNNPLGCEENDIFDDRLPISGPFVAVIQRGNCTFGLKTENAQKAGASGVIIVNNDTSLFVMSDQKAAKSFTMMVSKSTGQKLLSDVKNVRLSFSTFDVKVDITEIILVALATSLVALGAFFATADLRPGSPIAPREEEVLEVDQSFAYGFCFMGSIMLVVLYFLMRYLIYFIIFMFCIGGMSCIIQAGSMFLHYHVITMKYKALTFPLIGPVTRGEIVATVPAVVIVSSWLWLRNTQWGWIFQDLIGAGFLCWIQRSLRLPNLKIATILLSAMFFFDIFWVFLSPLFFAKSVMVEVATGGGTGQAVPMLLRMPDFRGSAWSRERLLGFGDIALPGLLISYLRRHDVLSRRKCCQGYFSFALVGYFLGLIFTMIALVIMKMGQPALLYLVPCTLWSTLALARCRGELRLLWEGTPLGQENDNTENDHESLETRP